jgi:hypothetical protein
LVFSLGSMLALPVRAQTVDSSEDFSKLMIATSQVKGLNTGLVRDEVNLYSGSLAFRRIFQRLITRSFRWSSPGA